MYNVYQHWDPLKTCVVGRSYPPEFYSWITVAHVRKLFERIAIETEEDYQNIIRKLESFGVTVLRPQLPDQVVMTTQQYLPPPMTPRDYMVMIGNRFYQSYSYNFKQAYNNVRDISWPEFVDDPDFFDSLPSTIQDECINVHNFNYYRGMLNAYDHIYKHVAQQGNVVKSHFHGEIVNGAMVSRIGHDLYFGTLDYNQDTTQLKQNLTREFDQNRVHVVNTGGHGDGTYCPVAPGLIISLKDVPTYANTFPGWEVVYLPEQSWSKVDAFLKLKQQNRGKWWIPGFENDQDVINVVESWLGHWTGYVEETVFDVNMLIIDPKNVIVFNYNKQVFDALDRYGITPHIVPFRHRYFWDGGIHCVTSDLHRTGTMQNYFPESL
jgi:hypothetical protein